MPQTYGSPRTIAATLSASPRMPGWAATTTATSLPGGDQAVATLVANHGPPTPDDFQLQLLRVISQLSDTVCSAIIRPLHDKLRGWNWRPGPP
jgi:hypothetical protein